MSADYSQLQQQINSFLNQQNAPGLLITTRPTSPSPRKVCFVYSGQGPQWWAMGRQLYKSEPIFSQWIRRIDAALTQMNNGEWSLLDELIGKNHENESRINDTNIAQPALFAIQVALTALLVSWGIYPASIMSHSAGEQAAAFVSGRVTFKEAIHIVYHRSCLQNRNTQQGGRMLSVSMSEEQVKSEFLKGIEHLVCVAVVNSPQSVTLSGEETTIDELQRILSTLRPDVFKARLRIQNAFHSHQMDRFDIRKDMFSSLDNIRGLPLEDPKEMFDVKCAEARLYSSVSGRYVDHQTPLDAQYWWNNVRKCVRFADAMKSMIQDGAGDTFLEISPHPVLATSIAECCEANDFKAVILPTLKRKEDEQTTFLTSIAQLTTSPVVWQHYLNSRRVQPIDNELFETFPLYSFDKSPCWYESKESAIERLSFRLPKHPLLGVRQWTQQTSPTWRSLINLNLREHLFLKDHKIQDAILFPATGFLELGLAACRQLLPSADDSQSPIVFENVEFLNALVLTEHELTEIFTQVIMPMREWIVYSRPWTTAGQHCMRPSGMSATDVLQSSQEFTLHARARIIVGGSKQLLPLLPDVTEFGSCSALDPINVYSHLMLRGYQYGPSCRLIQSLRSTRSKVEAQIDRTIYDHQTTRDYHLIHPAVIDACLHPALALIPGTSTTFLPVAIQKVTIPWNIETFESTIQMRAVYHPSICGLAKQRTYEFDCTITSKASMADRPFVTFERFTIQQIQGAQSGRWTSDKSIFDQVNILMDIPNQDFTKHLDTIMTDYCLKTVWTEQPLVISAINLLPSPEEMLTNDIHSADDEDLVESIQPLTELASCYAQMALDDLTLGSVPLQQPLLNACRSLASRSTAKVDFHSTQIQLRKLIDRFPRLQPILTVLSACGQRLREILLGEEDGLELLLGNEQIKSAFQQIQSIISTRQTNLLFQLLTQHLREKHKNALAGRQLRIFWLDGGNASHVLSVFQLLLDFSRESDLQIALHYTNSNSTALAQVEQTFRVQLKEQNRLKITYKDTFDFSNHESNESFDIVFAANKLQGNNDLHVSLIGVRRLLVPNGLLLLIELTDAPLYFDLIYGQADQWWSLDGDHRALLDLEQWKTTLEQIRGFDNVRTMSNAFGNSVIVAQKSLDERPDQRWLLFVDDNKSNIADALLPFLPSSNITWIHSSDSNDERIRSQIEQLMKTDEQVNIVFAWPLNQTSAINDDSQLAFEQHEKHLCGTILLILQTIQMQQPRSFPFVFVLTRNAQPTCGNDFNPIGSPIIGLIRSLTLEYQQHRLKLVDLQSSSSSPAEVPSLVRALAQHLIESQHEDHLDEIVLRHDGDIKRVEWHYEMLQEQEKIKDESTSKETFIIPQREADDQPFRLQVPPSRFLDDLTWVKDETTDELDIAQVEVRVNCVGLNFRDVLKARGLYPHMRPFAQTDKEESFVDRDTEPGLDFVGTVLRSPANSKVKAGDRVLGMSSRGMFHSHVRLDTRELVRIPNECQHFTDEQLAALPNACLTVLYSLKYRVHLRPDQTVLVHAATGGAGQACIQYCQSIGARVLATAGSEDKRRFLREQCGVEHVFNSRDLSFVHGVRALLPDGVDVVVNSLSGPLLQQSIKLISSHGHFVEWGKRDVFDKNQLSMFDVRNDCSFHVIDVSTLYANRLTIFGELLEEVMELIVNGVFKPIEPTLVYEPSQVIEVFKQSNTGQVMGKSVLRLTSSQQTLRLNEEQLTPSTQGKTMFPDSVCHRGTILISGGCGGLGLTMSRWMIEERGVKRLMLMSRRPVSQLEQPSNPECDEWLRLQGVAKEHDCHIDVVQVDVTNFNQVLNLIEQLDQTRFPVRGIIHAAVVQEDRSLAKLSQDNLTRVLAGKVRGAWNLHRASQLPRTSLHFFLLFSSIRNHLVDLAAGGYNAGNQFLDSLAQYRAKQLHLPALSISLPAVSGAGMFHRHRDLLTSLQHTTGFDLLPTVAVFELIERFHSDQQRCPCPIIFAANWKKLEENSSKLVTHQLRQIVLQQRNATNSSTTSASHVGTTNSIYQRLETIVERTQVAVARLLGANSVDHIAVDRSLVSQGMDSLSAVSLYNWLGQEMNIFIPLAELLQGISIQFIAEHVHKKLQTTKPNDLTSNPLETKSSHVTELTRENDVETSNSSSYTGTENIVCLQRPIDCHSPILFWIPSSSTTDNIHSLETLLEKISSQQSWVSSAAIYAFQMPQIIASTSDIVAMARAMISQMRRIQPHGPYVLVANTADQGESLVGEMTKQLKNHAIASVVQLLVK